MVKNVIILLLAAALTEVLWVENHPAPPPPASPAPHPVKALLEQAAANPELAGAAIGFCLLDPTSKIIVDHQAHTAFIPASSLKTVTTATALEKWGPDFRLETRVMASAPMQEGMSAGDVVIVGGADPMLSLTEVQSWAATLRCRWPRSRRPGACRTRPRPAHPRGGGASRALY